MGLIYGIMKCDACGKEFKGIEQHSQYYCNRCNKHFTLCPDCRKSWVCDYCGSNDLLDHYPNEQSEGTDQYDEDDIPIVPGFDHDELRKFVSEIAANTQKQIDIESNMTIGELADFTEKCVSSRNLEYEGLAKKKQKVVIEDSKSCQNYPCTQTVQNTTTQQSYIDPLKNNPIFQLSLSSKELFHSNFLYWLYIYDKSKFKDFIDALTGNAVNWTDNWIVLREDNNYDLSIRAIEEVRDKDGNSKINYRDYLLVIENKVKSIVIKAQLDKYFNEVTKFNKSHQCVFVLLSLAQDFLDKKSIINDGKWQIKSYADLVGILERVYLYQTSHSKSFDILLIEKYVEYIKIISDVNFLKILSQTDVWKTTSIDSDLQSIRFDDLRQKIIANYVASLIYDELKKLNKVIKINFSDKLLFNNPQVDGSVYLSADYSNGHALICVSKLVSNDVLTRFEIEGNRYKRGVIINKKSGFNTKNWKKAVPQNVLKLFNDNLRTGKDPQTKYPNPFNGRCTLKRADYGTYDMGNLMKYQSKEILPNSTVAKVVGAIVNEVVSI